MIGGDLGLDSLLAALREAGLAAGFAEIARLRAVFALEPPMANGPDLPSQARLATLLRAILVKSVEERALFEPVFEAWIGRADQGLQKTPLSTFEHPAEAPLRSTLRRKRGGWWMSALLAFGLAILVLGPHRNLAPPLQSELELLQLASEPGPNTTPVLPVATNAQRSSIVWVPSLSVTSGTPAWTGWAPLALGCLALLNVGVLWLLIRRRRWLPPPAPLPVRKGPPRVFLPPPVLRGPQLLSPREGEALAWGIGQFVAEVPTRRLDLPTTVRATARAAGLPTLRFYQARHPREVWLWIDEAAEDATIPRIADEVELALRSHGLPVESAHFRGVPDWLARNDGQSFAPSEVDERRDAALVVILTDGRLLARHAGADDLRSRLNALLRGLSHWPRLAFVDFSHGISGLADLLARHALSRIEPGEIASFLSGDRTARSSAPIAGENDSVWAAACALSPSPVHEAQAFEIRRRLGLQTSPWGLQALRAEAPGPPERLAWSSRDRARRLNWLRGAETALEGGGVAAESLLGRALSLWEAAYDRALAAPIGAELGVDRFADATDREIQVGGRETPARQHLVMERAFLKLWREAPYGIRELYRLFGGPLREEVRWYLGHHSPLDWSSRDTIQLPWRWEDLRAIERVMLQEMGLGGGMPTSTLRRPARVWAGMGLCLGLAAGGLVIAARSAWVPPNGEPLVTHDSSRPDDAQEEKWMVAARRWSVTVASGTTKVTQEVEAGAKVTVRWEKRTGACATEEIMQFAGLAYVYVCPGTFFMGSAEGDEYPAHRVTLSEYWIGKTEVTNAQFRRYRPSHEGEDALPATKVSWYEAKDACEQFGGRLPTEAEWEYAARAGRQTAWSFGDDAKLLGDFAWNRENSGIEPHVVGTRRANGWGLYDMHGNVSEWVADWYDRYGAESQNNPSGPPTGTARVLRGGAFSSPTDSLRSARRGAGVPANLGEGIGFRCARDPHQPALILID